jgi:hypothetical protein
MPRTIESILDSHHAADERRKMGKPVWDRKLRIKHLLSDESSNERAKTVGTQIAAVLRGSSWLRHDKAQLEADPETAGQHVTSEIESLAEEFADAETLDQLNAALDSLYDLADIDRVWIE